MSRWVDQVYDDVFDIALQNDGLLFVDFYADWCGPCRAVAPVIDRVPLALRSVFERQPEGAA